MKKLKESERENSMSAVRGFNGYKKHNENKTYKVIVNGTVYEDVKINIHLGTNKWSITNESDLPIEYEYNTDFYKMFYTKDESLEIHTDNGNIFIY